MANFKDYINKTSINKETKNTNENNNYSEDKLNDLINKYSGYSEDKLLGEFIKMTLDKKRKGELTASELGNIKNTITPFLNEDQKKKLNEILLMVENVK